VEEEEDYEGGGEEEREKGRGIGGGRGGVETVLVHMGRKDGEWNVAV